MIYATLEHLIRRELQAKNLFFPHMKKNQHKNLLPNESFGALWGSMSFALSMK
jgi:hypothetical protein